MLLANFIVIASISISGNSFLNIAKIKVESIPPLNAIEIFFILLYSIFSLSELKIELSIYSIEISLLGW